MAVLEYIDIPKMDPNLFTGPVRFLGGLGRSGDITLDVPYGEYARFIYVGVSGNLNLVKWDGTTQLYQNMPVGLYYILSLQVNSSGTTASALVWGS